MDQPFAKVLAEGLAKTRPGTLPVRPEPLEDHPASPGVRDVHQVVVGALKIAAQSVVILRRDGIELVVVAPRAAHRQPEEGLGEHVDLVGDTIGFITSDIDGRVRRLHQVPESGALDRLVREQEGLDARLLDEISRDVLRDQAVVGNVRIDRPDDVVPVAVGLGDGKVLLVPPGLRVTREIEPVLPPALAEVGRREEPVDEVLESPRRVVRQERLDLIGRRRQTQEVEGDAADPGATFSGRRRKQSGGLELDQDVVIQRLSRPARVLDGRWRSPFHRAPRPVLPPAFLQIERFGLRCPGGATAGIGRAEGHPAYQSFDLAPAQPALGRHLQVRIFVADRLDEAALLRLAGDDDRPALAALDPALPAVEEQPPLEPLRPGRVTAVALAHQERPDLALEEIELIAWNLVRPGRQGGDDPEARDPERCSHPDPHHETYLPPTTYCHPEYSRKDDEEKTSGSRPPSPPAAAEKL